MRYTILSSLALGMITYGSVAQTLVNNGAVIQITAGSTLFIGDSFTNNSGNLQNDGTIVVKGNVVNHQIFNNYFSGSLVVNGVSNQTVSGSNTLRTKNLVFDNSNGITLNTSLEADGVVSFTNGVVTAHDASAPLVFTSNAAHAGVKDASHVDGYVGRKGIGNFEFPVGDPTKYQPITVDITNNSDELSARYYPSDAGTGLFKAGGTSPVVLNAYNHEEYWTIVPAGTATGKVKVTWDSFHNPSITSSVNPAVLQVARKSGTDWLNEGATSTTGTISTGSVTGQTVSSWGAFALGSIPESALPVTLINFTAHKTENAVVLTWSTADEKYASHFVIERSVDGRSFEAVGRVNALGNSTTRLNYEFEDSLAEYAPLTYYRLRSVDVDGSFTLSRTVVVKHNINNIQVDIYPNPTPRTEILTIESNTPIKQIRVWDWAGREVSSQMATTGGKGQLNLGNVPGGTYIIQIQTRENLIHKKLLVK